MTESQSPADPTRNVLDLVAAESRRQDDLRQAAEVLALTRWESAKALRKAEAKRVDALRAGDQAEARARDAKVDATATTLAATVVAAAEAMRSAQAVQAETFSKALAEVQRWQYGQQGGTAKVAESHAKSGNIGLWVGIGAAVLFGALSTILAAASILAAVLLR